MNGHPVADEESAVINVKKETQIVSVMSATSSPQIQETVAVKEANGSRTKSAGLYPR